MRIPESELIINPDGTVFHLHLLPEELAEKAIPVGNSSLAGAVMIAQDPLLRQRFSDVAANTEEISLAGNSLFQELYMEYMLFPEEA